MKVEQNAEEKEIINLARKVRGNQHKINRQKNTNITLEAISSPVEVIMTSLSEVTNDNEVSVKKLKNTLNNVARYL